MSSKDYVIVALPPAEIGEKITQAKNTFNVLLPEKNIKSKFVIGNYAHITLRRPFYCKKGMLEEQELSSLLNQVSFNPIEINASEVAIYRTNDTSNVVVIKINENKQLSNLYKDIIQLIESKIYSLTPEFDTYGFTPHITVLYKWPEKRVEEAKKYITNTILPFHFIMDSFFLLKRSESVPNIRQIISRYKAGVI